LFLIFYPEVTQLHCKKDKEQQKISDHFGKGSVADQEKLHQVVEIAIDSYVLEDLELICGPVLKRIHFTLSFFVLFAAFFLVFFIRIRISFLSTLYMTFLYI
jgi:hypothetical protein